MGIRVLSFHDRIARVTCPLESNEIMRKRRNDLALAVYYGHERLFAIVRSRFVDIRAPRFLPSPSQKPAESNRPRPVANPTPESY